MKWMEKLDEDPMLVKIRNEFKRRNGIDLGIGPIGSKSIGGDSEETSVSETVGVFDTPLGRVGIVLSETASKLQEVFQLSECVLVLYPATDKVEWDKDMMEQDPKHFSKIWQDGFAKRQQNLRLMSVQLGTSILRVDQAIPGGSGYSFLVEPHRTMAVDGGLERVWLYVGSNSTI